MRRAILKSSPLTICLLALCGCGSAAESEDSEPPLKYTLVVNGKSSAISEDKPTRLTGDYKNPEVTLKVDSHRTFTYAGIEFNYPRHFAFEADLTEKDFRNWTISGNDAKVMIFDAEGDLSLEEFVSETFKALGQKSPKVQEKLTTKFGDDELRGRRAIMVIGEIQLTMDSYVISTTGGRTRMLVIQDVNDEGKGTKEGADLLTGLKRSFALKRR